MSVSLHPSGFIESSGSCSGPRYIRSQPSRESAGVLLNECESKYLPAFELPYRNVSRYIKEIQENWDRINPQDKDLLFTNLMQNLPQLQQYVKNQQSNTVEPMESNIIEFLKNYVSLNPYKNTKVVLDALYNHDDDIVREFSSSTRNDMKKGVRDWVEENFHPGVLLFLFLLLILTCVILVAYYQSK